MCNKTASPIAATTTKSRIGTTQSALRGRIKTELNEQITAPRRVKMEHQGTPAGTPGVRVDTGFRGQNRGWRSAFPESVKGEKTLGGAAGAMKR